MLHHKLMMQRGFNVQKKNSMLKKVFLLLG
jgi:hypothetical protein